MYHAILVDDEARTLQGIEELFPWKKYDMEVTGSYTEASVALEAILREKPDVVFTDIRMPIVSGIELMRSLRERNLDLEIVIISNFAQFEYAREALRLGAFDYCLKPISKATADNLLSRLKAKLDRKSKNRNNYILELLSEGFELSEDAPVFASLPHDYSGYQIIRSCHNETVRETLVRFLRKIDAPYISFMMGKNRYYLVNTDRDLFDPLSIDPALAAITEHAIGLSSVKGSQDTMSMISEATIASKMRFITGMGGLYRYSPPHYVQLVPVVKHAAQLLQEGSLVEFSNTVEKFPSYALDSLLTVEDLCFFWNQLILSSKKGLAGQEKALDLLCSDWRELLDKFSCMEDFLTGLQNLILTDSDGDTERTPDSRPVMKDSTFGKMLHYLNANYTKQIKLKDLAERFHINKNYASLLFKKHTNMTYSNYLNSLRMRRAKELLVSTSMPIAEVAENSGYVDYFYFNKLFKKTFGITPAQYRKEPL